MLRQHLDAAAVPLQRRAKHWEEPSVEIELMDDDEYDMEEPVRKPRVRKAAAIFTGTKLSVSNLDPGVTETDVKDLFSDVGELKSYRLFDNGVAEVVYKSKQDAIDIMMCTKLKWEEGEDTFQERAVSLTAQGGRREQEGWQQSEQEGAWC